MWAEPEPPPGGIKAGDLASNFTPPDGKTNSQCIGIELTPERMVRFSVVQLSELKTKEAKKYKWSYQGLGANSCNACNPTPTPWREKVPWVINTPRKKVKPSPPSLGAVGEEGRLLRFGEGRNL